MGCLRRAVCTRRTRAYLLEWLLTLSVIVVPLACAVFLIPFRDRAISLLDSSIQQPYYDHDSLPILSVFIPSVVLPLACFSLYPFALSRWPRRFGMPPHPFSFHYTYWWSSCLVQAVGLTVLLSELSKRLVQQPRPDFLYRCFPDGVPDAVLTAARNSNFIINTNLCTPPSKAIYEDGLQSFPSEHTSLSWCMAIVLLLFFKTLRRELVSQQMRMSRMVRCRVRAARLKNAAAGAAAAAAVGAGAGTAHTPDVDPAAAAALVAAGGHHGHHGHAFRARLLSATRHALHIPMPSPSPELRPPTLMGDLPVTCLDESATPLELDPDATDVPDSEDAEAVQDLPNRLNHDLESDQDQPAAEADADAQAEAVENGTAHAAPAATASLPDVSVPGLINGRSGSGHSIHGRSASGRSVYGRSGSGRSGSGSRRALGVPEQPPIYMSPFWANSHLVCIIHGLLPVGWAVAVSLSRAFDHKHNVGDIVGGAFVGIGVAFAVYRMHLIKFQGYHRRWADGDDDPDESEEDDEEQQHQQHEQTPTHAHAQVQQAGARAEERALIRKDADQLPQDREASGARAGRPGDGEAVAGAAAAKPTGVSPGGNQRDQRQLLRPFAIRVTTDGDSGRSSTGSGGGGGGVSRSWPPIEPKDGDAPASKHERTSKVRQSSGSGSGDPLVPVSASDRDRGRDRDRDRHESAFPRQEHEERERERQLQQRIDLAGALVRPAVPSQPLSISHPIALPAGLQHYPSAGTDVAAPTGAHAHAHASPHSNGVHTPLTR